jgi:hypothetical protein
MTRVTAWWTVIPLSNGLQNIQEKNYSFTFWTLTVLNNFIFITSCGAKLTHRDFRLALVKDLIQEGIRVPQTALRGRPTPLTKKLTRLDFWQSPHWPQEANCVRCRMCSAANKQTNTEKGEVWDMKCRIVSGTMFQDLSHKTKFLRSVCLEKPWTYKCKQVHFYWSLFL